MRILWLTINSSYSHSSLALPLTHAAAAGVTGWEWRHLQASLKDDIAALAVKAASMQPDLIAAPLYIFNREAVLNLLARIRQLLPGCVICVGGPECLGEGAAETLAQAPWLNFALRGEGESIFPELLRKFPETAGVPGVVTRENDGGTAPVYAEWA
ncbi:MAG: hypothetical protein J6S21_07560, partial [Victivallales bacterium]|nr:hypothetical protein [Victivallales bacterium]